MKDLQTALFDLNQNYLLPGVGEAMDINDDKANSESAFVKVFKYILSALMLISLVQYAFLGGKPPGVDKRKMRMMTEDSRAKT